MNPEAELLTRFKKQHGPITVALPRSRRNLQTHVFCSDGVHLPGINRMWNEPLCGKVSLYLEHCDPAGEQPPTCQSCYDRMLRMIE